MVWAITTFFNSHFSAHRLRNYREFAYAIPVRLLTVELAYDDKPFCLEGRDADKLVQIRGDCLWQKERCLNVALENLPQACDKVVAIDSDVLIQDPRWEAKVQDVLEQYPVAQPFNHVTYLRENRTADFAWPSVLSHPEFLTTKCDVAHGIAWAFRRHFIKHHGFYDMFMLGGADSAMSFAALGLQALHPDWFKLSGSQAVHYRQWADGVAEEIGFVGFGVVDAKVDHLWHGTLQSRLHRERKGMLVDLFNPFTDVAVNVAGAWAWATEKPELHAAVRNYLAKRAEG